MPPRAKQAIANACRIAGTTPERLFSKAYRRRTMREVIARRIVIATLYNPETAGEFGGNARAAMRWGVSDIARVLDIDHSTVLHHVRAMGLKEEAVDMGAS